MVGKSTLAAPIRQAGVVLSQPVKSTTPVERVGADAFLHVHARQVAVEHGRRLHQRLAERGDRKFERKAPGLVHSALDLLGQNSQVCVARIQVRPRVAYPNHGSGRRTSARDGPGFWSNLGIRNPDATRRQTTRALRSVFSSPAMLRRHLSPRVRSPHSDRFLAPSREHSRPQRQFLPQPFRVRPPSKKATPLLPTRRLDPLVRLLHLLGPRLRHRPIPQRNAQVARAHFGKADPRYGQDFLNVRQGRHRLDLQP